MAIPAPGYYSFNEKKDFENCGLNYMFKASIQDSRFILVGYPFQLNIVNSIV